MPAQIGPVTLGVADAERSLTFYRDLVGLRELGRSGTRVTLGAGATPVLELIEEPGVQPAPARASGLYHTAFLFPSRAALARVVLNVAEHQYPFSGASDHLVSEALYLDDPDGLGVELYRDRPREQWRWNGAAIEMGTLPLDVPDLLRTADRPFDGAEPGTRVGHVHLKVSGVDEAEAFYRDVIGFDVTARFGDSASFMSSGGYHHHLGANIWHSRGAPAAGPGFSGLRGFVLEDANSAERELIDPWGHRIYIVRSAERGVGSAET